MTQLSPIHFPNPRVFPSAQFVMWVILVCGALLFMRIFGGIPYEDPDVAATYEINSVVNFGTFWYDHPR